MIAEQPMDFDFKAPTLLIYEVIHETKLNKEGSKDRLEKMLVDGCMYDLYNHLIEKKILKPNPNTLETLLTKKNSEITGLEELRENEPEDESYVRSIDQRIAEFYAQTMDVENAFEGMRKLMRNEASLSFRMDVFLCKIRMGMIMRNKKVIEENVALADDTYDRGCDWDRRNRYKVYKGVLSMMKMNFREAGILFSDVLPSFESSEVMSYGKAVRCMIFCGLLTFDRKEIEEKILRSSEVAGGEEKLGLVLATSLFDCHYGDFMNDLYLFSLSIKDDVFLGRFVDFFCKEMKLRVYVQMLESYRSILIPNMAMTFGVSVEYVEKDLSGFIVDRRLWCKIDRVNGIVEMEEKDLSDVSSVGIKGNNVMRKIKKYIK